MSATHLLAVGHAFSLLCSLVTLVCLVTFLVCHKLPVLLAAVCPVGWFVMAIHVLQHFFHRHQHRHRRRTHSGLDGTSSTNFQRVASQDLPFGTAETASAPAQTIANGYAHVVPDVQRSSVESHRRSAERQRKSAESQRPSNSQRRMFKPPPVPISSSNLSCVVALYCWQ